MPRVNVDGRDLGLGSGDPARGKRPILRHYALVVGVDHYASWPPPLRGACADAKAFAQWACTAGGVAKENLRLLLGDVDRPEHPSQTDFDRALGDLVRLERQANPSVDGARLYVSLSGHGVSPDHGSGALLFPTSDDLVSDNASLGDYLEWLDSCRDFDEVVVIMDCCRSRDAGAIGGRPKLHRCDRGVVPAQRLLVLYGCEPGGRSLESALPRSAEVRGHLSAAVVEGLSGEAVDPVAGDITTDRLVGFVTRRVHELSRGGQTVEPLSRGAPFSIVRVHEPTIREQQTSGRLSVLVADSPLAAISVDPVGVGVTANGVGQLSVSIPAGTYVVRARVGPTELTETIELVPGGDVSREYRLVPDSVAPIYESPTSHEYHEDAAAAASAHASTLLEAGGTGSAIAIVVRTPAGLQPALAPLDRIELGDPRRPLRRPGYDLDWRRGPEWGPPDDTAMWAAVPVPAGRHTAAVRSTDRRPSEALVVPAWSGWQTIVFIASDRGSTSVGTAALDAVPAGRTWEPGSVDASLTVQAAWALSTRARPAPADIEAALAGDPGIIRRLLLGHLAADATGDRRAKDLAVVLAAALSADLPDDPDVLALMWRIASPDRGERDVAELLRGRRVLDPPCLARSATALIDMEMSLPGTIAGPAAAVLSARLPSSLWTAWSMTEPSFHSRRQLEDDEVFQPDVWAARVMEYQHRLHDSDQRRPRWVPLTAGARSIEQFMRVQQRETNRPAADILDLYDIRDLIYELGLPAVTLQAGLRELIDF